MQGMLCNLVSDMNTVEDLENWNSITIPNDELHLLIKSLFKHGVIAFKPEMDNEALFTELDTIINQSQQKEADFASLNKSFDSVLQKLQVNPFKLVRLLGSADNNPLTLQLIQFLNTHNIPVTVILSPISQQISKKLIAHASIKFFDYELNDNGNITLFADAPIDLDTIRYNADDLHVVYRDTTVKELAATIDKINTQVTSSINNRKESFLPSMLSNPFFRPTYSETIADNKVFFVFRNPENLPIIQETNYHSLKNHVLRSKANHLRQKHDPQLIKKEYEEQQKPRKRENLFFTIGFVLGAVIAFALVLSGVFAP